MPRLKDILAEHNLEHWNYGDGYREPRESGSQCSCGLIYAEWQQHACPETCSCRDLEPVDVEAAHLRHTLGVLVRARMLRSDITEEPTE